MRVARPPARTSIPAVMLAEEVWRFLGRVFHPRVRLTAIDIELVRIPKPNLGRPRARAEKGRDTLPQPHDVRLPSVLKLW